MKLKEAILTKNPCYTAGKKIEVKGLMLHSVGCPQPKASVFITSWNKTSYNRACVHAFIDGNDGVVYQTLPWDHRGWHGGGDCNNTHIGIEMCEPAGIKYTGGATFTCSDLEKAREVAKRTYEAAVELFAMLCEKYGLDPLGDGVIISHKEGNRRGIASGHVDPEHLWTQLGMGYTMDTFREAVATTVNKAKGIQATTFIDLNESEVIEMLGPIFTEDQKKSGILASISLAQFILESGYGKSELAQKANNCFGMKKLLSGNTWSGSSWDGLSVYTKQTKEQNVDGSYKEVTADFRKYCNVEASIADHSAYLLGAKKGQELRYAGIAGLSDYKKVAQLIKDGGYATSLSYVDNLCNIIERWNLTRFDVKVEAEEKVLYRVRSSWEDVRSQKGAYHVLENAKKCADKYSGYSVYDEAGNVIYTSAAEIKREETKLPYLVKVSIKDLNIRSGPGTNYKRTKFIPVGVYTIVEEAEGKGASKWGKLKSGAGWISLDYVTKL